MITCVIVDDEPLAIEVLELYVRRIEDLELLHSFTDPVAALRFVQQHRPTLIFLDIEMPLFNGLEFIKTLAYRPAVILATAYRTYAVESFELEALDYLVKPVPFPRFLKAVSKLTSPEASRPLPGTDGAAVRTLAEAEQNIWLKVDKTLVRVAAADIYYVESLKDYVRVKTHSTAFVTHHTLQALLELLPADKFVRIHKSYVVAVPKIEAIEGNLIKIMGKTLPIGRSFRPELMERLFPTKQ